jgi:hypothetical protein
MLFIERQRRSIRLFQSATRVAVALTLASSVIQEHACLLDDVFDYIAHAPHPPQWLSVEIMALNFEMSMAKEFGGIILLMTRLDQLSERFAVSNMTSLVSFILSRIVSIRF